MSSAAAASPPSTTASSTTASTKSSLAPHLHAATFLVPDYDEAIAWFTTTLGWTLVEDSDRGGGKRWVVVAPDARAATRLLLARATTDAQRAAVGAQCGDRVAFFWYVDDFAAAYARMQRAGVRFCEDAPRHETYGSVIVFADRWGNRWDLMQPATQPAAE